MSTPDQIRFLQRVWLETLEEIPGEIVIKFESTPAKLGEWIDYYGETIAAEGIRCGLAGFLKKMKGRVETQADAIYMNNYIGSTMRNIRDSIRPVEAPNV
jgi:hypothetical protein